MSQPMPFVSSAWQLVALALLGCGGATTTDVEQSAKPTSDAGASGGSGSTVTDTPLVCTSQKTWTRGNRGSSSMHPGGACIDCHASTDGPTFTIAGTVYPSTHEPDDCNGVSGSVQVQITGATGKTQTLTVNAAGNFYGSLSVALPFTAKVVSGTKERAMGGAQTVGDCNSCHTEAGAKGAPGRIVSP